MALTSMRLAGASLAVVLGLVSPGCQGGPTSPTDVAGDAAPQQSVLAFTSQPGDFVGGGRTYRFTAGTATFAQHLDPPYRGSIVINVTSADHRSWWTVWMGAPEGQDLRVGTYTAAERWTARPVGQPRFTLSGEGRACGESEGRFVIHRLTYGGTHRASTGVDVPLITRLDVSFTHRCTASSAPGLTGDLSFVAAP